MKKPDPRGTALVLRLGLVLTAVSLWVYIPYRYATRPPEFDGALGIGYAILFPLSALLAWWAFRAGLAPDRVSALGEGPRARGLRGILGGYGAAWLVMGLMCVPSLAALSAVSPAQGLFATLHMTAQHVFLGLVAVTSAWRPHAMARLLDGTSPAARGASPAARESSSPQARPREAGGTT